ncbi:MAG TPA: hypothetical protein VGQ89_17040 [Candidatus Limnocylindrales bacterium]|nr:hypothetical protein [Candidatus Limnocylindrales bacterium]
MATVAIGGLLGFLVPTVAADFTEKPEVQAQTSESPVARTFINAYVADDQGTLDTFGASADTKQNSARFKAEYAKVDPPVHLGSWIIGGGITVHAYASHVVDRGGQEDQLAWRVLTVAGSAAIIDPPPSVQTP